MNFDIFKKMIHKAVIIGKIEVNVSKNLMLLIKYSKNSRERFRIDAFQF